MCYECAEKIIKTFEGEDVLRRKCKIKKYFLTQTVQPRYKIKDGNVRYNTEQ